VTAGVEVERWAWEGEEGRGRRAICATTLFIWVSAVRASHGFLGLLLMLESFFITNEA
jgi:hypothetical protein